MAEINLRSYIKYIEERLAEGANSEVIAHCRHILETYPRYIEVYTLLARALADQEEYHDALDTFQRVLSVNPNDFVAHIGMSECYHESNMIDQAIWHLERAFEQVPSNLDVQDEIKRLYKERDGEAPLKIQLTGGALARLYAKGKLYQQAVIELTKAIARDPERLELQALLADVLWQNDQIVEAGKVAAELLAQLPYNIDANRILAQLWLRVGQPNEARPFLVRVREIDPYLGYQIEYGIDAPAGQFTITRLDYTPTSQLDAADWVSDLEELEGIEKRKGVTGPLKPPPGGLPEPIPEAPQWLSQIGTGQLPAQPESPVDVKRLLVGKPSEADAPVEQEPAPAGTPSEDAPDWLQDVLSEETPPEVDESIKQPDGQPDWLSDVLNEDTPVTPPPVVPGDQAAVSEEPAAEVQIPDWLGEMTEGEESTSPPQANEPASPPEEGAPDWLQDVLDEPTPPELRPVTGTGEAAPSDRDAPDWLKDVLDQETDTAPPVEESAEKAEVVSEDWLDQLLSVDETAESESEAPVSTSPDHTPSSAEEAEGQPLSLDDLGDLDLWDQPEPSAPVSPPSEDWLEQDLGLEPPAKEIEQPEADTIPDWLTIDTSVSDEAETQQPTEAPVEESLPDWLSQGAEAASDGSKEAQALVEVETSPGVERIEPEEPGDAAPVSEEGGTVTPPFDDQDIPDFLADGDLDDSDAAIEWLEELAAKYDPDFEPSQPGEAEQPETETADVGEDDALPDWLKETAPSAVAGEVDDELEWLRTPAEEPAAEEQPAAADLPDWLTEEAEEPEKPAEPVPEPAADLPDWLTEEAEEPEKPAEPVPEPEPPVSTLETSSEALSPVADVDDALSWLDQQVTKQGVETEEVISEALTPDQPPVTSDIGIPAPDAQAEPASAEDLPEWLKEAGAEEEIKQAMAAPPGEEFEFEFELDEEPELEPKEEELEWLSESLGAGEPVELSNLDELLGEEATGPAVAEEKAEEEEVKAPLEPVAAMPEEEELPDWLKETEKPVLEEPLPDWLAGPDITEPAEELEKPAVEEEEELPEWLREPTAATEPEEEEIPDWLAAPAPAEPTEERLAEPAPPLEEPAEPEPEPVIEETLPAWMESAEKVEEPVDEGLESFLSGVASEAVEEPEPVSEVVEPPAPPEPEPEPMVEVEEPEPVSEVVEPPAPPEPEPEPEPTPVAEVEEPPTAPPVPTPVAAAPPVAAVDYRQAPASIDDADIHLNQAREAMENGNFDTAFSAYEGLVSNQKLLREVVADLSKHVKTQAVVKPRVYRIIGDALMAQGNLEEALEMYQNALDRF